MLRVRGRLRVCAKLARMTDSNSERISATEAGNPEGTPAATTDSGATKKATAPVVRRLSAYDERRVAAVAHLEWRSVRAVMMNKRVRPGTRARVVEALKALGLGELVDRI